ncbi:unnamed protein product [Arabidopsis arenosa]|uniref:Uncharacterized protein n=1 Tax=Arabidopsis arenosa TaxID=38785 RepID=A0A8S2AF22_ARAAE|nr:unnamed protein product [Arabidopsis arenosa]
MSLRMPEGWPPWLISACGDSIKDLTPRRATTYEKLEKIRKKLMCNVVDGDVPWDMFSSSCKGCSCSES